MNQEYLWNINQLLKHYPALKHWGVRWLIRNRRIPIVKIGRRIFFDPEEISRWKDSHKVEVIEDK